jgi:hypothetical protein
MHSSIDAVGSGVGDALILFLKVVLLTMHYLGARHVGETSKRRVLVAYLAALGYSAAIAAFAAGSLGIDYGDEGSEPVIYRRVSDSERWRIGTECFVVLGIVTALGTADGLRHRRVRERRQDVAG